MKNLLALALAGLFCCGLPALADEAPPPSPRPVFAAVSQGLNVSLDGAGAGFRLGQNFSHGAVILGLQTELTSDSAQSQRAPCVLTNGMCSAQHSAGIGLSGRLGVMLSDHVMVFFGAGLRQAKVMAATRPQGCGHDPCYLSINQRGWDMNAGIMFASGGRWQMQADYHYGKRFNAQDGRLMVAAEQENSGLSVSLTARF